MGSPTRRSAQGFPVPLGDAIEDAISLSTLTNIIMMLNPAGEVVVLGRVSTFALTALETAEEATPTALSAAETLATKAEDLAGAATRAAEAVGPGRGPVYGTHVHSAFEDEVAAATEAPDRLLSLLNPNIPWQSVMASRAQLLKDSILRRPAEVQSQLAALEAESVRNLGLESFR